MSARCCILGCGKSTFTNPYDPLRTVYRLCIQHLEQWHRSLEYHRENVYQADKRGPAAFVDFVRRIEAEERNYGKAEDKTKGGPG